jgi:glycosyltransferase involved in cell wall biosynthesis
MKKITVAIPAFRRDDSLRKLLKDLNDQTFNDFIVIVANDDPTTKLLGHLDSNDYVYELQVIDNDKNIGLTLNYLKLLGYCKTEYFMWLADDDKISNNYLEINLEFLEANNDYCCSVGNWIQVKSSKELVCIHPINSSSKLQRYRNFISENSDHFIYGLFRYKDIENYKFYHFLFPNHKAVENWCFPFLIQFLSKKKFNVEKATMYFDNIGSVKKYLITGVSLTEKFKYKLRRLNVNLLYIFFFISK